VNRLEIVMTPVEGLAALKSVKSIYDIAKEVRNSGDPEKLRVAAAQMFDLALSAREQTAALQEERNDALVANANLKQELSRMKSWEAEEGRYQLRAIYEGSFAYALKTEANNGEPPHWLCPTCFQQRKKSVMQRGDYGGMAGYYYWNCPVCKTTMQVDEAVSPTQPWIPAH
jgi:rubrerythrin